MSVAPTFECDECKQTTDSAHAETFCAECFSAAKEKIDQQWERAERLTGELLEVKAQLELEAEVFAKQIREKDLLINDLLAKVHAA